MQIVIDVPNPPSEQKIIDIPIHFCGGQVVDAGGYGFDVLPKGHGRLIDADALRTSFGESIDECSKWADAVDSDTTMYARISQTVAAFFEASLRTEAQPTLVAADNGVDNG